MNRNDLSLKAGAGSEVPGDVIKVVPASYGEEGHPHRTSFPEMECSLGRIDHHQVVGCFGPHVASSRQALCVSEQKTWAGPEKGYPPGANEQLKVLQEGRKEAGALVGCGRPSIADLE